jgi:hypothetical protein
MIVDARLAQRGGLQGLGLWVQIMGHVLGCDQQEVHGERLLQELKIFL